MSLSTNINEKASLIWSIADKLTGVYKPHEYGEVILPLTVLKRFDCVLADTKAAVVKKNEELKISIKEPILRNTAGHSFYNTSKFDFKKLLDDPNNIEVNFKAYINGFSENALDIIKKFKFEKHIDTMVEKNILYNVIYEFTTENADLHPNKISNIEMGYIFEEIIRRFSESHNEDAGQHYTPREVIELMVNLVFNDESEALSGESKLKTMYDGACGTGGILSAGIEYLNKINSTAKLICFGQELNDQTYAICKADMLIKGLDADNIKEGNTLSEDKFPEEKFDFILMNPPFGREWKNEKDVVMKEFKLGHGGRFGAGLPGIGDSQMLFLENAISKMKPEGSKIAIIHNGSPLFKGDAEGGESEIRRYVIERDLLDCIIALPNNIFYNTGITTYIWLLSNKKPRERRGKIQLINANNMYEKRRKALGEKRNDISPKQIEEITKIYGDYKETEISKIFKNEEFGYRKITIENPLRDEKSNILYKKDIPQADTSLRDTENVPLNENIHEYFQREVLPFAKDSWINESKTKIGYEIPFTRYFYKYNSLKPTIEIMQGIMAIDKELDGELKELFEI